VHALRHVHGLLVRDGLLVDVHPVAEEQVEAAGGPVGVIAEPDWLTVDLPNSEAALRQAIAEGLYELEAQREYDVLQHFDAADALLEAKRDLLEGQDALVDAIRAAPPPLLTRMRVVFRRLRALPVARREPDGPLSRP
jgi:hypothetical protein